MLGCILPAKSRGLKDLLPGRTEVFVPKEVTCVLADPQEDATRLFPSKSRGIKFNLKHVFY